MSDLPLFRPELTGVILSRHHRSTMQRVTIQVFPLRANMSTLRGFIDSYLNFVDDYELPPFNFRPAMPYVLMLLINYPRLAVTSENLTALPQHEISFSVPLECYAIENGGLIFKQYGTCTPFLYLDKQLTIVSGRDLFGLPKISLRFDKVDPPAGPSEQITMSRMSLRQPGAVGDEYVDFIQVLRDPPIFSSTMNAARDAWNAIPRAVAGAYSAASGAWEATLRPPISGYEPVRDIGSMVRMRQAVFDSLFAGAPFFTPYSQQPQEYESTADIILTPFSADLITLKQFRDAERTELACYQSIVRSAMYLDRFNDGGLINGPTSGDPTAGIWIDIRRNPGQPVVDALGLQVEDVTGVDSDLHSSLRPVYPFWMNVDLVYGLGKNLYWRGRNTRWSSTNDPGEPTERGPDDDKGTRYITFGGGALQEAATLFVAPNSNIEILALPIDPDHCDDLEKLVYKYLKTDTRVFHLFSKKYVYMIVRRMVNTSSGIGAPAIEEEEQIEFVVPIVWYDIGPNKADPGFQDQCTLWPPNPVQVQGVAFMRLYVLSDSQLTTITESEVFGLPTMLSVITGSESPWTSIPAPPIEMTMITASTDVLPGLNSGQAPDLRTLVRVNAWFRDPLPVYEPGKGYSKPQDDAIWKTVQSSFESLSKEIIPSVSLKQVVDCREPDRADFQAIVLRGVWTENAKDWTPSPHRLRVKFHSYDSVPLVETMGLKVTCTELDPDNQTNVQVVDAVFAFSFSSEMRADIAVNLDWCHGNCPWQHTPTADALIKIEFSFAPAGASRQAVEKAVADDVKTAIGRVCALEGALGQWAKLYPPKP